MVKRLKIIFLSTGDLDQSDPSLNPKDASYHPFKYEKHMSKINLRMFKQMCRNLLMAPLT
jgi:hypothetical protein